MEVVNIQALGSQNRPHVRWYELVVEVRSDRKFYNMSAWPRGGSSRTDPTMMVEFEKGGQFPRTVVGMA